MTVYVITGARAGLGLEYVRQLSPVATNTIFALVRSVAGDLSALRTVQSDPTTLATIHILPCDVSSPTSISSLPALLLATHPSVKIDILLNNAAILHHRTTTTLTLPASTLQDHLTTNTVGPALLLQALYPLLGDVDFLGIGVVGLCRLCCRRDADRVSLWHGRAVPRAVSLPSPAW
jgi:NAD(P)-dependent dehydrogenase (short-subunit alcohol dehydrogenase family)